MTDVFAAAKKRIEEELKKGTPVILALEGGAATGKSTLGKQLADEFQAPLISMDDFFLPLALRTEARFSQPGGNIHYERFHDQVAQAIRKNEGIRYQVFDCGIGDYAGIREIAPCPLLIVEGVYSLHPAYRDIYSLRFFLKTTPETQDARLHARGEWLYDRFQSLWLPLESAYFGAEDLEKGCDLVLET